MCVLFLLTTVLFVLASLARDKISKADGCQGNDDKVDGLQCTPALNVFEYDGRQGDEEETTKQNENNCRNHTDLGLTHIPLLRKEKSMDGKMEAATDGMMDE